MNNQFWPIVLNFVASLLGAVGQWLYKVGAKDLKEIPLYKNLPFLGFRIVRRVTCKRNKKQGYPDQVSFIHQKMLILSLFFSELENRANTLLP